MRFTSSLCVLFVLSGAAPLVAQCNNVWQPWPAATTNGVIRSLTTMPNGDLIAGGDFTIAGFTLQGGGVSSNYIARWDGVQWSALGTGMNGPVYAVMTLPNGDLIAGGAFTMAGGVVANRIATQIWVRVFKEDPPID